MTPRDLLLFPVPPGARESAPDPEVSVVVPVFNEEPCLELLWSVLHPVLERFGRTWEVVFVDDASLDGSLDRLLGLRAANVRVRVVRLDRHSGQTAALDAGFRAARGRWIVTLDADLQNPPREIPRLLTAADGVDLVYGRRRVRRDSRAKRLASRLGNAFRNAITGHRVRDTGCSLKVFRRSALERIPLYRGMHRFLPTLFAAHGFRIRELDVDHAPRVAGVSKHGIVGRATRGLVDCLAVRWMMRRSLLYRSSEDDPAVDG